VFYRRDKVEGTGSLEIAFIIFGKAAVIICPCKGALDNPATREDMKAFPIWSLADNFQDNPQSILGPLHQIPGISLICPDFSDGRKLFMEL
jgi:hypothetical protein